MSDFPLYNQIAEKVRDRDLTAPQKLKLAEAIEEMGKEEQEKVYMLIKTHQDQSDVIGEPFILPYSGKTVTPTEIMFDMAKFPHKLRQVLYYFVKLHKKSL